MKETQKNATELIGRLYLAYPSNQIVVVQDDSKSIDLYDTLMRLGLVGIRVKIIIEDLEG